MFLNNNIDILNSQKLWKKMFNFNSKKSIIIPSIYNSNTYNNLQQFTITYWPLGIISQLLIKRIGVLPWSLGGSRNSAQTHGARPFHDQSTRTGMFYGVRGRYTCMRTGMFSVKIERVIPSVTCMCYTEVD